MTFPTLNNSNLSDHWLQRVPFCVKITIKQISRPFCSKSSNFSAEGTRNWSVLVPEEATWFVVWFYKGLRNPIVG